MDISGLIAGYIPLLILPYLAFRCILGAISHRVMRNRNREGGFWWGFFLGILGIVVEALRP